MRLLQSNSFQSAFLQGERLLSTMYRSEDETDAELVAFRIRYAYGLHDASEPTT
jgi:hypothetical protein